MSSFTKMSNKVLQTKPYLFDRYFDTETASSLQDGSPARQSSKQGSKKGKRYYDEEDLKKAREEARNEVILEFETSEHRRLAEACEAITKSLKNNEATLSDIKGDLTKQCITLAAVISKKLLVNMTDDHNIKAIESMVLSILPSIYEEIKINIKVNDSIVNALQQSLEPSIKSSGFTQQINVVADQTMTGSDCILEWTGGGASRSQRETWENLKRMIETVTEQPLAGFDDLRDTASHGEHDPHSTSSA
ncbi:MAG: hypothetical protein H6905_09135 [Hyphomicrobiales bacterium]|nr:hypothetical protein [Hyphomicrobiales bacterium]